MREYTTQISPVSSCWIMYIIINYWYYITVLLYIQSYHNYIYDCVSHLYVSFYNVIFMYCIWENTHGGKLLHCNTRSFAVNVSL